MKPAFDPKTRSVRRFKNSPEGEEELIQLFFGDATGHFVDVGANDPFKNSQSWHLGERGWNGLLIEPMPDCVIALLKKRKAAVAAVACSSPANHGKRLHLQLAGSHSTLEPRTIALGGAITNSVAVECRTLDSVLTEYKTPKNFDFLSIDVEGHELELFKGFDINKWKPRLVILEDHVTHHKKHRWMSENNYQLILRTGLNSWYVPREEGWSLGFSAQIEKFRKYWLGLLPRRLRFAL